MNASRACGELVIIGVSEHGSPSNFLRLKFCLPVKETWATKSISRMVITHAAPFFFHRSSSCSTFPLAPHFATGGRGKREITSRCMIARIGCPEGLVHYAFSLASSLRFLCRSAGAFAIKMTMMTNAISIALPTEFLTLRTKSYASRCLFLGTRFILPFSSTVYIFGLSIFIRFFLIARNVVYIDKTLKL